MNEKIENEIKPFLKKTVNFKTIVADFDKMTHIEDYQKVIGDNLKGMSIAVLALNAGAA
jgi:hypothetical protein